MSVKELAINCLEQLISDIKSDNCSLSDEKCTEIIRVVSAMNSPNMTIKIEEEHPKIYSKETAAKALHISRATFDRKVSEGKIPEGTKIQGVTSHIYLQEDINNAKHKLHK